jgi:molecular chaperone DnaJ
VFSFSSPCPRCQGKGTTVEYPCGSCRGSGREHRAREVKVRIPAGVDNGQRIRLKGRGAPGHNGGPAGDLLVECKVMPHATFSRDGVNLLVHVPVAYHQAVLGSEVSVPTLDGSSVLLKIKSGTQSGSKHRVKGRGIETTSKTGDLIVTIDVLIPSKVSKEEREIIEQLAELHNTSDKVK